MLKKQFKAIIMASKEFGWVLEPEAKRLLSISGIDVPKFLWARSSEEATQFAGEIDYPVAVSYTHLTLPTILLV